jgi:hypothetical protein
MAYWHVVGASDPGPYTWNNTVAQAVIGWLGAYAEVDNANPADPSHPSWSTNGTTTHMTSPTIPRMSTVNANEMVMTAWRVSADATWTPPADMVEAIDMKNATNVVALGVDHAIQPQAGASGRKTAISSAAGNGSNVIFAMNPATAATTLGSTTVQVVTGGPALLSPQFATSSATFADGDRLVLDVTVPDDPANCGVAVTYDGTGAPSKLTVATIVPEGIAGLLLLAPALPFGARWWKRRRP